MQALDSAENMLDALVQQVNIRKFASVAGAPQTGATMGLDVANQVASSLSEEQQNNELPRPDFCQEQGTGRVKEEGEFLCVQKFSLYYRRQQTVLPVTRGLIS